MVGKQIPFRPKLEGDFKNRFYKAVSVITIDTDPAAILSIAEKPDPGKKVFTDGKGEGLNEDSQGRQLPGYAAAKKAGSKGSRQQRKPTAKEAGIT